jgi:hypothetical protein
MNEFVASSSGPSLARATYARTPCAAFSRSDSFWLVTKPVRARVRSYHAPAGALAPAFGRQRLDGPGGSRWTIPARDAGGASAMLWAWSTCPECRDRRWTG